MTNSESALVALRKIKSDFTEFCNQHGKVSEADTRAQVIDRVLENVLGWPSVAIERERYVRRGPGGEKERAFIDYGLQVNSKTLLIVEAKKEGVTFEFPRDIAGKAPKLSGTLLSTKGELKNAISQVREYCDETGVRFAIATNGYAWIVFRAVRDDIPWKEGHARVFPSLDYIESHFPEFWNLLSYSEISGGSLTNEFSATHKTSRALHRVSSKLFNADVPLARNRLHGQLGPIIKTFFDDIGELDQIQILKSCYVYSGSLNTTAEDLNLVIRDTVPKLLQDQGTKDLTQDKNSTGSWGQDFSKAITENNGELFLLLGGIGCGKTTFLKRYQKTVGSPLLEQNTYWFHISFLGPPIDPSNVERYIYEQIQLQIRSKYEANKLESRESLKIAFHSKIQALNETLLSGMTPGDSEYEKSLSPHLAKWQEDVTSYIPLLLRSLRGTTSRSVAIFIDNVDQLTPVYQQQIFVIAQGITRATGSITVVALREESYYSPATQKTFEAYATRKFHIASPRFRHLVGNRIKLALDVLTTGTSGVQIPTTLELDKDSIVRFLLIVEFSIFDDNKNLARFIEALCFGNMRKALQWFSTFLMSGATDVDKMLRIHKEQGGYFVAYHEFVKSIMLSERQYYSEDHSPILNLFECGSEPNSSHFTSMRLLSLLLQHVSDDSSEGRGYFELSRAMSMFEDIFNNREDFVRTCNRLVKKQLIEANTRSTESILGASHIRATTAGWYYLKYLVSSFSYLDLVLQDTPLNDPAVEAILRASVQKVGNLSDKSDKVERTNERFSRVEIFLEYLEKEEHRERGTYELNLQSGILGCNWISELRKVFDEQKSYISRRIRENRERFAEDFSSSIVSKSDDNFSNLIDSKEDAGLVQSEASKRPNQLQVALTEWKSKISNLAKPIRPKK
jgi:hypothetical protein